MPSDRLDTLREMLADDPEDAFTRYALAMELKGRQRRVEAIAELDTLLREQPDYVAAYYQAGGLLHAEGRTDEAVAVVRRGLEVAERAGEDHARSELAELLDELEA